jgi:hypothetical protein
MLSVVFVTGGCALPDTDSFRAPDSSSLFRRFSVAGTLNEKVLPPVTAADMVDASGRCAGAYVPAAGDQPSDISLRDAGVPVIPAAISLDMTECDVVKRAGVADKVDIGAQGVERSVTLTYLRGERPGIYRFAEGRLKSMELAPEPPPTARTAKKPAKPPARRASQNQVSVQ